MPLAKEQERLARPRLEPLEGRCLPGESLLAVALGALLADGMADISPPLCPK